MRMEELPPFYLKTHSDVDAQILNQLVLIIIFVRVESIHNAFSHLFQVRQTG